SVESGEFEDAIADNSQSTAAGKKTRQCDGVAGSVESDRTVVAGQRHVQRRRPACFRTYGPAAKVDLITATGRHATCADIDAATGQIVNTRAGRKHGTEPQL